MSESICPCEGEQAQCPLSKMTRAAALSDAYPVCIKTIISVSFRDPLSVCLRRGFTLDRSENPKEVVFYVKLWNIYFW